MLPTTNSMIDAAFRPARLRHAWPALGLCLTAILAVAACGGDTAAPGIDASLSPDAGVPCDPNHPAMTYTQLYATFFAASAPTGHCAKSGCHGGPDFNVWLCGPTKDSCYMGMVTEGLINTTNPVASKISDPKASPLVWVNPDHGFMPADAPNPFPAGRDAINAWALACAQNN